MSTSVKIMSGIAFVILVILAVQLARVRTDLRKYLQRTETTKYKTTLLDTFHTVRLSSNWDVRIRQGREFKVLLTIADTIYEPKLRLHDGILHFEMDSGWLAKKSIVHAKVIAPLLSNVISDRGSVIDIEGFKTDSLMVSLGEGCVFTGRRNEFGSVSFNTNANARIDLTDVDDF
jgi:hypothetical protein